MGTKSNLVSTLALFSSFSTLLCCALPALLVSLGAGAALAGLVSAVPQLVWLSEHKAGLFIFAGVMLALSGISRYMTRNTSCPVDIEEARACQSLRRTSSVIFCCSLAMYMTGFFFAFIAQYLIR